MAKCKFSSIYPINIYKNMRASRRSQLSDTRYSAKGSVRELEICKKPSEGFQY